MIWAPSWLANSSAASVPVSSSTSSSSPTHSSSGGGAGSAGGGAAWRVGRGAGCSAGRWPGCSAGRWTGCSRRPLAGLSADLRGAAVNGGPDLQVGTDHLDQAVTQHVDAAAPLETLQGALAGEPEQQLLAAHLDDVGVLAEQRVSEPLARLHLLQHLRPQPAQVGGAGVLAAETAWAGGAASVGRVAAGGRGPGRSAGGRWLGRSPAGAGWAGPGAGRVGIERSIGGCSSACGTSRSAARRQTAPHRIRAGRSQVPGQACRGAAPTGRGEHAGRVRPDLRRAAGRGHRSTPDVGAARWYRASGSARWRSPLAARVSSPAPKVAAWLCSRSAWSADTSIKPDSMASGTCATITRSRRRSSRSSANRRGS